MIQLRNSRLLHMICYAGSLCIIFLPGNTKLMGFDQAVKRMFKRGFYYWGVTVMFNSKISIFVGVLRIIATGFWFVLVFYGLLQMFFVHIMGICELLWSYRSCFLKE